MAKINQPKTVKNEGAPKNGLSQGSKGDRVLSLINLGLQDVKMLADTYTSIASNDERRKATDTDNYVKKSKAETDAQKETNRHNEEMAKIEHEWKKIADAAIDRERRLSFIQGQIERFQAEYDKYMAMEDKDFLSSTVTSRLESLRKIIMELTKELNRV